MKKLFSRILLICFFISYVPCYSSEGDIIIANVYPATINNSTVKPDKKTKNNSVEKNLSTKMQKGISGLKTNLSNAKLGTKKLKEQKDLETVENKVDNVVPKAKKIEKNKIIRNTEAKKEKNKPEKTVKRKKKDSKKLELRKIH